MTWKTHILRSFIKKYIFFSIYWAKLFRLHQREIICRVHHYHCNKSFERDIKSCARDNNLKSSTWDNKSRTRDNKSRARDNKSCTRDNKWMGHIYPGPSSNDNKSNKGHLFPRGNDVPNLISVQKKITGTSKQNLRPIERLRPQPPHPTPFSKDGRNNRSTSIELWPWRLEHYVFKPSILSWHKSEI